MTAPWIALFICAAVPAIAQERVAQIGQGARVMTVRSTTDLGIIRPVLDAFLAQHTDLAIFYEQWGSNELYAESLKDCDAGTPGADAVFSSAVHQLVYLVNRACAQPYQSENTRQLPHDRRWRDELWGITEEPAVMIYNTDLLPADAVPSTRFALLDLMRTHADQLRGRIATYDIAASGLGYLFAYADSQEATTFGSLLEGFARVEAVVTCCSSEIMRDVSEGRFTLAYNILGSYVAHSRPDHVGVVLPEDYTLFLTRGYLIPTRAAHSVEAGLLLDFLTSVEGQARLREEGLIYTVEPFESGLPVSARRPLSLGPWLLVALDASRSRRFQEVWSSAFQALER